jgi:outer membrane biosynthesis protein TonB
LGLYGIGRFFLSYFRTDPAVFAGLRQAQLASLLMVAFAVIAIPILFRRSRSTAHSEPAPAEPETEETEEPEPEVVGPKPAALDTMEPQVSSEMPEPVPPEPPPRKPARRLKAPDQAPNPD